MNIKNFKSFSKIFESAEISDAFDKLYDKFRDLEKEYNSYDIMQLKWEYKLIDVLQKAKEYEKEFNEITKKIKETDEDFDETDNKRHKLYLNIDDFIDNLEKLNSLFTDMGDLDKGSHYFKNLIL